MKAVGLEVVIKIELDLGAAIHAIKDYEDDAAIFFFFKSISYCIELPS